MESNDSSNQNQSPRIRKESSSTRWRGDSHLPSPHESDSAFSSDNDLVIFDLPLLRSDSGVLESESPRSIEFRQRNLQNSGKGYMAIDMESGAGSKCSESVDKLDNSGNERFFSVGLVVKTVVLVIVWYTFSTLLTLYNKTLLGDDLGNFPLPLMMNTVHFGMQAVLSSSIVWVQSRFCRANVGPTMTWRDYFIKVVPTALGTALDINLSNASLVFISVSFATMCKSASPIFLLLFAFAFRLESPSFKLLGIILVISVGILFTVAREAQFEFWGFFFVMLAAVMSGFRWCMTQILLQKETYGLKNPITLMSYVTPVMTLVTALFSLVFDRWHNLSKNKYFDNSTHIIHSCLLMLLGGSLAFFMVLTEYMLVSATSAVTVTIAGIIKEAVTIMVAVFYFDDQFTFLKGIGLLVIIVGVGLFNWYKYTKLNKGGANQSAEMNSTFNNAAKYVILDEDFPEGEI